MEFIRRANEGAELVLRLSRADLYEVLALDDPALRKLMVKALVTADLVRPHRKARGPNVDGFTLPPGWEPQHVLHLRRRARTVLEEQSVRTGEASLGRILRW